MIASEQDELLAGMEGAFKALNRLQKASDAFQAAFPLEADIKAMDPAASAEAVAAAEKAGNIALVSFPEASLQSFRGNTASPQLPRSHV